MPAITMFVISFMVLTCKAPNARHRSAAPPDIRIGVIEEKPVVNFRLKNPANASSPKNDFAIRSLPPGRWRVEVLNGKPAQFKYRLAFNTSRDRFAAEEVVRYLLNLGLETRVQRYDRNPAIELPYFEKSVYQVILIRDFKTEAGAKLYQQSIREKAGSEILAVPDGKATGIMSFTNLENNYSFDSPDPIRLSATSIEIAEVEVGRGFHWESSEARTYNGTLEFLVDDYGKLSVVNELSLEEYLKGVVPSEMPVAFPFEALKAQAIAARVEAIAKAGLRHPLKAFDLCDDVHCQVFSGSTRRAQTANNAVESTHGIFMIYRRNIIEAFYAAVCGGHTEDNQNVWLMDAKPYLSGVLDSRSRGSRLSNSLENEENVKRWIDSEPDVNCNTLRGRVPEALNYSKKYFRWEVKYDRTQLEKIIREKTGEEFGLLVDLVPRKRGVSGRMQELEVVGTKKRFIISRELPIRQALSKTTLYSASCYFKKEGGMKDLPARFIIKGAGWGHGVGMCQIGAGMMAQSHRKFDEILTHYYRGITLEVLYE
jgi:SpoIID/LytB domain protein